MITKYSCKEIYHSFLTAVIAVAVTFESIGSRLESCIVKSKEDHMSSISAVQRSSITLKIVNSNNQTLSQTNTVKHFLM